MTHRIVYLELILASVLPAQTQGQRIPLGTADEDIVSRTPDCFTVNREGRVRIRRPGENAHVIYAGVPIPGQTVPIGHQHITDFVIVGGDNANGIIEHWTIGATSTWALASSATFASEDFSAVAFDGNHLFVLACESKQVWRAPWTPSSSVDGLTWTAWVTESDIPDLAEPDMLHMHYLEGAISADIPSDGLFLFNSYQSPSSVRTGWHATDASGSLQVNRAFWDRWPALPGPIADEASANAGDTTLLVHVSGQQNVEVLDGSGMIIGSASSVADDSQLTVPLSSTLTVGAEYTVRLAGASTGATFTCIERHGYPETFIDGVKLGARPPTTASYHINNPDFSVSVPATRDASLGNAPALLYVGIVIVGLTNDAVVPYDNGQGTNQLLDSLYWIGALGGIRENANTGHISLGIPLANDPALVDVVFKTQFAIHDGAAFRLSEVIGGKVQ